MLQMHTVCLLLWLSSSSPATDDTLCQCRCRLSDFIILHPSKQKLLCKSLCQTFKSWISPFFLCYHSLHIHFYNNDNNNVKLALNNLLDIKFHHFCVAAWILKALMAKMLISELIKGEEQYLGCHGWLLSCRGSVVCFEALIMAAQTYNYELSEVRKLLEMNRQRGSRLLEGTYQTLLLTHSADGRWKWMSFIPKTRYSSLTKN